MRSSTMKWLGSATVAFFVATGTACGGGSANVQAETPASGSVKVSLDLPKVGNPKYDAFFDNVTQLAQLVADARATLDDAAATLNKAAGVTGTTDFDTALKNVSAKLKGKVTVTVNVTPTGADVAVVPVAGVTLTADEQATVDAYKQVVGDIAAIPTKLAPVVAKSVQIIGQAAGLVASAKTDFTGFSGLRTLPSVISGIGKVTTAVGKIKDDVPVMLDKAKTMTVSVKAGI
jgi:hypothetical protein